MILVEFEALVDTGKSMTGLEGTELSESVDLAKFTAFDEVD